MFLIACPLVFLAGFLDSIAGGGGLISLPAYLVAGLPSHLAIGTNKLSSVFGTFTSTVRFARNGLVNWKIAVPTVFSTLIGAYLGANLSLMVNERVIRVMVVIVIPIVAAVVFNKKLFVDREEDPPADKKLYIAAVVSAFIVGAYDGFYGPGAGTFLIIAFNVFGKMKINSSNAQAKVINLTSNIVSVVVFFINGQMLVPLGLAAGCANILGNYLGSGLVMHKGAKYVKPLIIAVLSILLIRIILELTGIL